ncbi:ABC transporter permease subunit, partial [Blautia producta]|nr:ABC transporter permease subunit [Blautia producta]
ALFLMMVASLVAPFQVYMIPIVKIYGGTFGLNNSLLFLSVVALGLNLPFSIFLIRGFLNGIPIEIEQAAMIDGCSYIQVFFRIVIPMLKPIVITLLVFVSMGIWN